MIERENRIGSLARKLIVGVVAMTTAGLIAPATFATCYGTWYDYYTTPACIEWVGTTVKCPGFPDQHDTGPGGTWVQTPYFITQAVVCPCPGTGGGSGSGNPDEDGEPPPEGEGG